jgi:hypothetical protein
VSRSVARGPRGSAPPPPPSLHEHPLPLDIIPAGTVLHRIHRSALPPLFFGPGAGNLPTYRFDSLSGAFGVLYVGRSLAAAIAETLLRNPARRMVAYRELALRSASEVRPASDLRLVRLYADGLQRVGTTNAVSTGPYGPCGRWADALWAHPDMPDGIAYQSRHDSGEICLAIFDRPRPAFAVGATVALADRLPMLAALLARYGKSISGAPAAPD